MIAIKSQREIEIMQEGGKILSQILTDISLRAKEGVTTLSLNQRAEALIFDYKAIPAFKGYQAEKEKKPYPFALCASLNEVVVHGAPSEQPLKKGDLLGLDLGIKYKGYFVDMALSLIIGEPTSPDQARLVKTAKKALKYG
ncbi:M24 family metallopeptidase, partial [Candidatus Gribaldobacteria bacterium]|nr:M24 family metallopeptidase [Candidatus Gribaldobacteria bacterium]